MGTKVSVRAVDGASPPGRLSQIGEGAKEGVLKTAIDKIVDQFVNPLVDNIQPFLNNLHAGLQMAGPAFKAMAKFGLLIALAEIFDWMGPALARIPGIGMTREQATAKCKTVAAWVRRYAAEAFGKQVTEAVADILPQAVEMFKNTDVMSMLNSLPDVQEQAVQQHQQEEAAVAAR